ncbi:hypothetical protein [Priestia megaterium]|uniref:hypothetical protein n=1 Tax=Priestia megaterium TaxID=1404 RepID=UPI00285DAD8A|nr:hypothetical protein [Priestia megaterium]MDR7207639.1 hypothetical protein [Priestia megaterium]
MAERLYTYGELFIHGKDKEVYEVAHSPLSNYVGKRFVIRGAIHGGNTLKHESMYDNVSETALVTPTSALTGSKFKKVEAYTKITLSNALARIERGDEVYLGAGKTRIGRYTDISDTYIVDFDDLFEADFYIK